MARQARGAIETHEWRDGRTVTVRARVRAYGHRYRIDFGTNHEGWSVERGQVELDRILAQIERGTWEPPSQQPQADDEPDADETFHVFASRWWQEKKGSLTANARADYEWRLRHLLAHFHRTPMRAITRREVDRYRAAKLRERESPSPRGAARSGRALSNRSINMTLDLLAQILEYAVEYDLLDANPARGKRRRLPSETRRRDFLEADMVLDLLEAAGRWEHELPSHQRYGRRALLAMLCLAGPRILELCETERADVDLALGRVRLGTKTQAGLREVELTDFALGELQRHLAAMAALGRPVNAGSPLFPTRNGGRQNPTNVRNRLLRATVERVNAGRAVTGRMLLPDRMTPHTLRRTFASLSLAAGRDPRWVMAQIGHTDARFTLNVYGQVMQRQRVDRELVWTLMRFADEPDAPPNNGRR